MDGPAGNKSKISGHPIGIIEGDSSTPTPMVNEKGILSAMRIIYGKWTISFGHVWQQSKE
jgi:hypothetical protein